MTSSTPFPIDSTKLGGTFTFPGTSLTVNRMGYGAMQLAGKGVWGPPKDEEEALAVLREAVASGVNHIDTSDFYGPHVTNQIIKKALHPYPPDLVIVTKLGAMRGEDKSWKPALKREDLIRGVEDNLRNLGLEALEIVNLRVGGIHGPSRGINRGAAARVGGIAGAGVDPASGPQQCDVGAVRGVPGNRADRLRAEPL